MRAIQKPMGLRSVGTAKCQNYFLNKKHWGGGAKATQVIAPPAPNYTNCLRNQLTQQTYATNSDGENFLNALPLENAPSMRAIPSAYSVSLVTK